MKIENIENNLIKYIDTLELKFNLLKDQVTKLTKAIDDDKNNKESSKSKINDEFSKFESKIKNTIAEDRDNNKINNENLYKKIENLLMKQELENKSVNEIMQKNIKNLRDYIEV